MIPNWLKADCPKEHIGETKTLPNGKSFIRGNRFCIHINKVPQSSSNDILSFMTYDEAKALASRTPNAGLGIGLFGPLCGVDIDHCITNGQISPEAQEIIDFFKGAYIEKSPSGTGVHILFACADQHKYSKYYTKLSKKHLEDKGISGMEGLEFYQGMVDNRYFTLTEDTISSSENNYTVTKDKIKSFLDKYFIIPTPVTTLPAAPTSSNTKEDLAWARFGLKEIKDEKFIAAYKQPATGSGGTESEDDLALAKKAAFWTNNNPEAIRIVFESSPHYKTKDAKHLKKWARADYSNKYVIDNAVSTTSDIAKNYYTSYHYDESEDRIVKGGDDTMIAPKIGTRVSQKGETLATVETKTFKFESAMPQLKKGTTTGERTVQWISCYKKGSNDPSTFLERTDPAFEAVAGIVLEKF